MSSEALRVERLQKAYGRHVAVQDATFSVAAGELACLIGPNGAGKSTTMRCLAGLQMADSGTVHIGGELIVSAARAKRVCGMTPQDVAMFEYLTGAETLAVFARVHGVADVEERSRRWLVRLGLDGVRDKLVRQYSGGMKRKLAVACAMLHEPPVVILDESFTGLDPESTAALQRELREYCNRGGAVLLSSHILDMVYAIADRVIVLAGGACVASLSRAELHAEIPSVYSNLTALYLARTGARVPGD